MNISKKLVLWAWFEPELVKNQLIPEIESNCEKYGIYFPNAYNIFSQNKYAKNCLYFHHDYAESDIFIGQEYTKIALRKDLCSEPEFIQDCHAKVLCFFTAFRTQPSDYAMSGHHELSLIQFRDGIPQIIYDELYKLTEMKPLNFQKEIYLYL